DASAAGFVASANFAGYLAGAIAAGYGWAAGRERGLALSALAASACLLFLMALVDGVLAFAAIRFLAGVASAFAMLFTSAIVLAHGLALRDARVQMLHFSGVGIGIALSAVVVYLVPEDGAGAMAGWRLDWLAAAACGLVAGLAVWRLLPATHASAGAGAEPRLVWTRPLAALTLSYGLFGIGYIVTATFIIAMVRQAGDDPLLECLTWLATGVSAAVSLLLWKPVERRVGILGIYAMALLLETAGVAASALLMLPLAALAGGGLLGLTFIVVTAYGLQLGRHLSPGSPRRVLSAMTAAFGVGQIVGPLMAGFLAERSGGFGLPSLVAAGVLALAALCATVAALPARLH
ncbi:MFS transporter, partial [Rhizobium sp. TRM95111]|uniref:YbfB/YjiJ family MFS transporter n=1 Tax=Rhizobium alarense TaxID=2846851 RepID=UPI001F177ECA